MKPWWLIVMALPLMAAAPSPRFTLSAPGAGLPSGAVSTAIGNAPAAQVYEPAPLPNLDASAPSAAAAGGTTLAPSLFTQREQFRGDGFSPGSTAQGEQERNVRPAAGFSLHMALQPN